MIAAAAAAAVDEEVLLTDCMYLCVRMRVVLQLLRK